jgi:lipopolysaccharide/colanic/teichoic acid biosynthesis glycosyltransferase
MPSRFSGGWGQIIKSFGDRVTAASILALIMPLLAVTAIAIKLGSRGPVVFCQRRYGFDNEVIGVSRFRSTYTGRPGVTPVGRVLQRTSLD